ncbi:MAG: polysaccharide deacetylase family protein [Gallionella sp.]
MKKMLALKINVDTYRGTREGVPRLMELLKQYDVQATFFFSMGPDHTGRAIKRIFRPGFIGSAIRTSVLGNYGIRSLLYGTLLPAPDIGKKCSDIMLSVRDAGFDLGIHSYDHYRWQEYAAGQDEEWSRSEMQCAVDRYTELFGEAPHAYAAANWQTNRHALRYTQHLGFEYCSDTRGSYPFIPTWRAEIIACPQVPTTLPTLDELINRNGVTLDNIAQHVLNLTEQVSESGHVFTLRVETDGGKRLKVLEQLLGAWQSQGYEIVSLRHFLKDVDLRSLPHREVEMRAVEGCANKIAYAVDSQQ